MPDTRTEACAAGPGMTQTFSWAVYFVLGEGTAAAVLAGLVSYACSNFDGFLFQAK